METVLVTGGAGFIGSHICKALAAAGLLPVAFDDLSTGHADFVRWGPLVKGDILDAAALDAAFARHRPGAVIHFAALAYVGESVSQPLAYYRVNVAGLVSVVEAMLRHGARTIVFSSSCATYCIPSALPITESAPQRPINPYGRSKLAGEQILTDARAAQGPRVAMLRYFNAAGADPDGGLPERHDPETHLIPLAIDAATGQGPPLSIFGTDYPTEDGTCERDFIHVSDLGAAHVEALRHLDAGNSSLTLNLGTGKASSVRSVIAAVERATGRAVALAHAARRPGDPPMLVADASLAREVIGFRPRLSDLDTIVATAWKARAQDIRPQAGCSAGRLREIRTCRFPASGSSRGEVRCDGVN
jgi:UDP-arabinose 4-epimerase